MLSLRHILNNSNGDIEILSDIFSSYIEHLLTIHPKQYFIDNILPVLPHYYPENMLGFKYIDILTGLLNGEDMSYLFEESKLLEENIEQQLIDEENKNIDEQQNIEKNQIIE